MSLSPYKSIPGQELSCKKNVRPHPSHEILPPHIRTHFCHNAPLHTFMIFFTKNSNSKNKNLCASSQNFVWGQNWEKIIENEPDFQVDLWTGIARRSEGVTRSDFDSLRITHKNFDKIENLTWIFIVLVSISVTALLISTTLLFLTVDHCHQIFYLNCVFFFCFFLKI